MVATFVPVTVVVGKRQAPHIPSLFFKNLYCYDNSWQMSGDILSSQCSYDQRDRGAFTKCFCWSLLIFAGAWDDISGAPLSRYGNLRAVPRLLTHHWMWQGSSLQPLVTAQSLSFFGQWDLVTSRPVLVLSVRRRVTLPSSPPTCVFPARSGASQNKQGEINTGSGQLSAG